VETTASTSEDGSGEVPPRHRTDGRSHDNVWIRWSRDVLTPFVIGFCVGVVTAEAAILSIIWFRG
jgi:hypothetical protein